MPTRNKELVLNKTKELMLSSTSHGLPNIFRTERKSLKIITIDQSRLAVTKHDSKTALVKLKIVKDDDSPLKNFAVNLTSYKLEQTFLGKTNYAYCSRLHQKQD